MTQFTNHYYFPKKEKTNLRLIPSFSTWASILHYIPSVNHVYIHKLDVYKVHSLTNDSLPQSNLSEISLLGPRSFLPLKPKSYHLCLLSFVKSISLLLTHFTSVLTPYTRFLPAKLSQPWSLVQPLITHKSYLSIPPLSTTFLTLRSNYSKLN